MIKARKLKLGLFFSTYNILSPNYFQLSKNLWSYKGIILSENLQTYKKGRHFEEKQMVSSRL